MSKFHLFQTVVLVFALYPAWSDVPIEQRQEIDHLIGFIEKSNCILIRNGVSYSGIKAVDHVRKKYAHFSGDITSTEDFILFSATKSTLSGSFYQVNCSDSEIRLSRDWLLEELQSFRDGQ